MSSSFRHMLHTGKLCKAQKYENAIMSLHCEPSQQEKRTKKLSDSVSREYAEFCENHPDSTQEQRKQAYARIHDRLFEKSN